MDQFVPVIFVSIVVAFIVIKNIKRITEGMEQKGDNNYANYASFSTHIQEYIRDIKKDINQDSNSDVLFVLKDTDKKEEASEKLSDFIRKLVFFETLMAKNKTKDQIEAELVQILTDLEAFVRQYIQNGDMLAEKIKEDLQARFQKLID